MRRSNGTGEMGGLAKTPTGIPGFDEITGGGLPRSRTSLVIGGPGSGKTVFALQTLVNGARQWAEPGIFVAFEENSRQIVANAATFGWDLLYLTKSQGITLVCTSLLEGSNPEVEATPLPISTIADAWIHLAYVAQGGERNRALTIVKSRGTRHSNQVRELILSDAGVTLTDIYTAGGEVLMGTLRWEKEAEMEYERERIRVEVERKRHELELAEAEAQARMQALKRELEVRRAELARLQSEQEAQEKEWNQQHRDLLRMRSAGGKPPGAGS